MSTNVHGQQVSYADLAAAMTIPSFPAPVSSLAPGTPPATDTPS